MAKDDTLVKEQIKALLFERKGYEANGHKDQAAGVTAELKKLGHKGKAPAKRAATRTGKDTAAGKSAATRKKG